MKLLQRVAPDGARQVVAGDNDDFRVVIEAETTRELGAAKAAERAASVW